MKKIYLFLIVFLLAGTFTAAAEALNVTSKDGAAVLTWDAVDGAASYYILKDYGYLDNVDGDTLQYTDTDVEIGHGYSYIVAAQDENGDDIWMSDEASVLIEEANKMEYVSVYKNGGDTDAFVPYEMPHYGLAKYVTDKTIMGGKSMRWAIRRSEITNELKLEMKNITYDISELAETGYAQFYIYPETSMQVLPDIGFFMYGASKDSNVINVSSQIQPNRWNTVKVPIADMLRNRNTDPKVINQIWLRAFGEYTSATNFYIQGLGFYDEIRPPKAELGGCGIDGEGNSYAELVFSKSLDVSTVTPGAFTADGLTVTDVKYKDKKVTVYFAETLVPSKTYRINISGSVADNDGKYVDTASVLFTAPKVFDNVYVHTVGFNMTKPANGELVCNAEAAAIYSENGGPQDITMIVVVKKGDKIMKLGHETKEAVETKRTESFSVSLNLENIPDGCTAEVYFTDTAENGKPLCEVKTYFE